MSSGGLLFTNYSPNDVYGLKKLFPDNTYCTYKEDFSDVLEKARNIVHNTVHTKMIAEKGMKHVQEHHNHKVRTLQLIDIIQKEFGLSV